MPIHNIKWKTDNILKRDCKQSLSCVCVWRWDKSARTLQITTSIHRDRFYIDSFVQFFIISLFICVFIRSLVWQCIYHGTSNDFPCRSRQCTNKTALGISYVCVVISAYRKILMTSVIVCLSVDCISNGWRMSI